MRVNKVIVGYDISRTSSLTLGSATLASNLAEGEVIVLDKNMKLMTAGQTIQDTDTIYIGIGAKETFTDVNGYSKRPIIYSDPIVGSLVRGFRAKPYAAAVQKIATCASVVPLTTAGVYDYVLRIVYTDNMVADQTPSQFVQEYRVTSNATDCANATALYDAFRAQIAFENAKGFSGNAPRVVASGTSTLILTGHVLDSDSLTAINDYFVTDFKVYLNQVTLSGTGAGTVVGAPSNTVTYTANTGSRGNGTWQEMRDLEKKNKPYRGVMNMIDFPVPSNVTDFFTVKAKTYHQIVIDHDASYNAADNNYIKETKLTTHIALTPACTVLDDVLAILNPWIESLPGGFAPVTGLTLP